MDVLRTLLRLVLYKFMKIILLTISIMLASYSAAEEMNEKYQSILVQYANTALQEFDFVMSQSLSESISARNVIITSGKDKIGRMFYVVLYPSGSDSVYVAMELTKDGFLEIHGRGGLLVSPKEFRGNFHLHINKVVHYPGAT
mgnify:CR=1 FL=1